MKLQKYIHRTVTYGDWGVGCTTGTGINGAILNVYRHRYGKKELRMDQWMSGFGDSRLFPDTESAFQFAFEHGYLKLYFTDSSLRARRKARAHNPLNDPTEYARYKKRSHSLLYSRKTWMRSASANGVAAWTYEATTANQSY